MAVKQTIVEIFEAQAKSTPNATALIFDDNHITYADLNERANQLAHYLQKFQVGPDVMVGICVERSIEMVIGILGILKAGGAYVPLDPDYPIQRLSFMLDDTRTPLLLTQKTLKDKFVDYSNPVLCLDSDWQRIEQEPSDNPHIEVTSRHLAYIMYTSGSTGQPKGTCIEHRSVVRLVKDTNYVELGPKEVFLQIAPISFDASTFEIWGSLLNGAKLIIFPPGKFSLEELGRFIQDLKVTTLWLTAALFHQMVDHYMESLQGVKQLLAGGETLSVSHVKKMIASLGDRKLINGYGPTENTTFTTCHVMTGSSRVGQSIPIGIPISNTQVYVLDQHMQPVPVGVYGELYIGGDGLAREYLNQPDLTKERFVPHPFSDEPNAKLYKTGDKVRYLADGTIEFLGRFDHQVKIHGHRIELAEIEAILNQHPGVRAVAVVAHEYDLGDKRLAAYIVPRQEQSISIRQLRDYLSKKLPKYMIPASFTTLDTMPLTPNGKVDRKALPMPELDRSALDSDFRAPRNATEETLANIWAQVIGLERVGINDNFFELGGDSILSIQITSKSNQIGIYLTPDQLFHYPTIAQLADIAATEPNVQAEQGVVTGPLPLTPIQHWFFEQSLLESHHWNQAFLLRAPHTLEFSLLEKAIYQLLIHHDALRLRFALENSEWHQMMTSFDEVVPVSRMDLSGLTKVEQKIAIQSTATELQASLDLSKGPLIRVALFERGSQEFSYLLIIIHHLAVDGVSWRILLEHLEVLYNQLSHNQVIQLPPKTTSYKQWAHQLTEYAQSDKLQQELPFWLSMQKKQPSPLPVDYPRGIEDNTVSSTGIISVSLNVEETETILKQVPKTYHTQINDVLLTALSQAVSQWAGTSTLLVDLEGHGREVIFEDIDLLRTVGWFTTIFPVSLSLGSTSNPGEMLKSIKEQLRRIPNRGIGYGLLRYLRKDTEILQELRALPQAELSFNYLGQFDQILSPASPFKLTNESYGPRRSLRGNRRHLLEIAGSIVGGKLQLNWVYCKNIHRKKTIESLAQGFMKALRNLIDHCQSPTAGGFTPSDFPEADLSQDELDDLMSEISEL